MPTEFKDLDRYLLITSDSHAGMDPEGYRPYIETKYLDDFDAWLKSAESMAQIMRQVMGKEVSASTETPLSTATGIGTAPGGSAKPNPTG